MLFDFTVRCVDHIHRTTHRIMRLQPFSSDIDREEFSGYTAGLEPSQVGMERIAVLMELSNRTGREIEILVDHRRRNVIMAIDDYRFLVNAHSFGPYLRIGILRHGLSETQRAEKYEQAERFY